MYEQYVCQGSYSPGKAWNLNVSGKSWKMQFTPGKSWKK